MHIGIHIPLGSAPGPLLRFMFGPAVLESASKGRLTHVFYSMIRMHVQTCISQERDKVLSLMSHAMRRSNVQCRLDGDFYMTFGLHWIPMKQCIYTQELKLLLAPLI